MSNADKAAAREQIRPAENGLCLVLSCLVLSALGFPLLPKSNPHSAFKLAALHGENPSRISQPSTQ
jgi:hypothetical protein